MRYTLFVTALILAFAFAAPLSADKVSTTSGVWLTAADFASGTLTAAGSRDSSSHKMLLHDSIFGKPYIEVMHNGETFKYDKNAIWGFRDYDGKSYRFVDEVAYEVREAGRLIIYTKDDWVAGRKGRTEPSYYFSVGAFGAVTPLTILNLKSAFPTNHRFHDYLDMMPGSVTDFDQFHNTYRVNHFLYSSES